MHKKGKNKNKQKHPNPIPPQQDDLISEIGVKEIKEEVRVPEIVPEVLKLAQDLEANVDAEQTPIKPKRHRAGKKRKRNENKQDNTTSEPNIEKSVEAISLETEVIQTITNVDIKKNDIENISKNTVNVDLPVAVPPEKKKKGKQQKIPTNVSLPTMTEKNISEIVKEISDSKITSNKSKSIIHDTTDRDQTYNKTNNKKNNNNVTESSNIKSEGDVTEYDKKSIENPTQVIIKEAIEYMEIQEQKNVQQSSQPLQQASQNILDSKGKKKNKKDKMSCSEDSQSSKSRDVTLLTSEIEIKGNNDRTTKKSSNKHNEAGVEEIFLRSADIQQVESSKHGQTDITLTPTLSEDKLTTEIVQSPVMLKDNKCKEKQKSNKHNKACAEDKFSLSAEVQQAEISQDKDKAVIVLTPTLDEDKLITEIEQSPVILKDNKHKEKQKNNKYNKAGVEETFPPSADIQQAESSKHGPTVIALTPTFSEDNLTTEIVQSPIMLKDKKHKEKQRSNKHDKACVEEKFALSSDVQQAESSKHGQDVISVSPTLDKDKSITEIKQLSVMQKNIEYSNVVCIGEKFPLETKIQQAEAPTDGQVIFPLMPTLGKDKLITEIEQTPVIIKDKKQKSNTHNKSDIEEKFPSSTDIRQGETTKHGQAVLALAPSLGKDKLITRIEPSPISDAVKRKSHTPERKMDGNCSYNISDPVDIIPNFDQPSGSGLEDGYRKLFEKLLLSDNSTRITESKEANTMHANILEEEIIQPVSQEILRTLFEKHALEETRIDDPGNTAVVLPSLSKKMREIENQNKDVETVCGLGEPCVFDNLNPNKTACGTKDEKILNVKPEFVKDHKKDKDIEQRAKNESNNLKHKVMEVNKDMEDLKISIEKSLAGLNSLEEDNMPELVSLTDSLLSGLEKQETTVVLNVETQMTDQCRKLMRDPSISDDSLQIKRDVSEIPMKMADNAKNIIDGTKEPLKQKNKGKGKSHTGQGKEAPVKLALPNSATSRNKSPMLSTVIESPSSENIEPNIISSSEHCIHIDKKEKYTESVDCSQEPKNKNKGKSKNKSKSDHYVQPTDVNTQSESTGSKTESAKTETQEAQKESKDSGNYQSTAKNAKSASDQESKDSNNSSAPLKQKADIFVDEDVDCFQYSKTSILVDTNKKDLETKSLVGSSEMLSEPNDSDGNVQGKDKKQIENPLITNPKNLLGLPDIPVTSNKIDYKKEKDKKIQTPNAKKAKIKVKDLVDIEGEETKNKHSKESQTENKVRVKKNPHNNVDTNVSDSDNDEDYVYKYSFRKVFLANSCHICMNELKGRRLACSYCNLMFYCGQKHKDEDWPQHQALCFAVSTIVHLKGLKFIYGDAAGCGGQNYRLLRMQAIVSCEKILKRKLLPQEQECLLYPRICCDASCREWRGSNLKDCEECGLTSYCKDKREHLISEHATWCKSYRLYYQLVTHQQKKGRLEPELPTLVVTDLSYGLPDNMNQLLEYLYHGKLKMDEVHYAALTQLATAPLTAAYTYQLAEHYNDVTRLQAGVFTLHVVGAELQFEADTLNKWEVFFMHLKPDVKLLKIVFVGPELNPSKLPLDLLAKIKLCRQCRQDKRRIIFEYEDGQLYHNYASSARFTKPDIVCAFNPGLHRATGFSAVDSWPATINCILQLKTPFCVTSYTRHELPRDLQRIRDCSKHQYIVHLEPSLNPYSSVRPDRNFISDDEMPLIFKNYYLMVLAGAACII